MSLYLGNDLISGSKPINLGVRNIGEIVASSLPLTDAGLHLLDGSLLPYGVYKEFIDYIADLYAENPSANYFTTEALWQQSVTTYGVCGKFVYDSVNNTVRLPKVTGIIEGTVDVSALGDLVEAGLPNITGNAGLDSGADYSGPFYSRGSYKRGTGFDDNASYAGFDLSLANSIYGNSNTVQPQTIKAFYYIVIANSTKTDIQSDIDNIATDLNGKADVDLSNINASQNAKNTIVQWGMPDYANGISLAQSTTSEQQFTMVSDGIIAFTVYQYGTSNFNGYVYINNQVICEGIATSASLGQSFVGTAPVSKNDIVRFRTNTSSSGYCKLFFYPLKGV